MSKHKKDKKDKKDDKAKDQSQDAQKDKKKDSKRLCKWDKDAIEGGLDKLRGIVVPARFICRRCGRVANESSYLCKPVEL